jgi:thymidine kinase
MSKGSLEVICGSMFSGKTEELMRRLRRAEFAKQQVLTIKHDIDVRKSYSCIVSHNGEQREAFSMSNEVIHLSKIIDLCTESISVIGIDEIQFFPPEIITIISELIERGKRIIVAGLDLDFRGLPFGIMPSLLALAEKVTKLRAICVECGKDACHTQRLINGKPARFNDPVILVGAEECYQARCRNCFTIDKPRLSLFWASLESKVL